MKMFRLALLGEGSADVYDKIQNVDERCRIVAGC